MRAARMSVAAVFILLLVGSGVACARDAKPETLSLVMTGEVLSVSSQSYSIQGGQLVSGSILGSVVKPWNSVLHYGLTASVSGLSATGSATFDLSTTLSHGLREEVKGTVTIVGMTPAVSLPLGCTGADCTGAIPALFNGIALVTVYSGNSVQTLTLGMAFESAYLNPFGGPIFFESSGNEVVVIASYSQAGIKWVGVQMGGDVSGSAGGKSVTGSFGMVISSSEDLRSGMEKDKGSIAFLGMSDPSLNAAGSFSGYSTIPRGTASPCTGFPPGTCNQTGLVSYGVFSQTTTNGGTISGQYATQWSVPAVGFESRVSAILTSSQWHH